MEYKYQTLELKKDYEGRVVATLISSSEGVSTKGAILYIHGYIDYFFQDHLAQRANDEGYAFYAIDLRKYGRSLLSHQHFNYCRSLEEYFEEITMAIEIIENDGHSNLSLLGHSTGGLISSLYASKGAKKASINKLALNSPFLEFNTLSWVKKRAIPLSGIIASILPYASKANELNPIYNQSIDNNSKGEWNYNKIYKPDSDVPLFFAWLNAIREGHIQVKKGLQIECPIAVLCSSKSAHPNTWDNSASTCDIVLNVEHIKKYSKQLGSVVELHTIDGAIHDIFLSSYKVREQAFKILFTFLNS